jgi:preprotein translocase subunit SecG
MAENRWTSLGENAWTSLGENTWTSIARKMTQSVFFIFLILGIVLGLA